LMAVLLCACQGTQGPDERGLAPSVTPLGISNAIGPVPIDRAQLNAARQGPWLGGPEPVSGKLRSGITTYHRTTFNPDGRLALLLRFEDVVAEDATVQVRTSDGAKLLNSAVAQLWPLRANETSKWALDLELPLGDSYLHVMTAQRGRQSTRSILLHRDGGAAKPREATEGVIERDAKGEPIVRMQATSAPK
jgi:hypothetical protein